MKNLVDLHTHTVFSRHAFSSLTENIDFAQSNGLKYFGTSDHQPDNVGHGANIQNFQNQRVIPKNYRGLHILKGIELNAGPNLKITLEEYSFFDKLDYFIASFHPYDLNPNNNQDLNTKYYLEACDIEKVKILGHIDDGRYPCDYETIIDKCIQTKTFIELNNSSLHDGCPRTNSYDNIKKIIKICKEKKCPVILDSDAHIKYDIGNVELVYGLCKELMLSDELIANRNIDLIKQYFNL